MENNIVDQPAFILTLICMFIIIVFPNYFGMEAWQTKFYIGLAVIVQSLVCCSVMDRIRGK